MANDPTEKGESNDVMLLISSCKQADYPPVGCGLLQCWDVL